MALDIPNTLVDNDVIEVGPLNANFDHIESRAVDKTGDTMTGTLNVQHVLAAADNTYDLGSASFAFRDLHLDRNALVGGTLGVTGAVTLTSTLAVNSTDASALDVAGGAQFGSGNVALIGIDGKINGPLSSTIIDDLSAANLTSIPAANLLIASQAIGDLLYASSTTAWTRLADVATGSVLVSGGVGAAPAWSASPTLTGTLTSASVNVSVNTGLSVRDSGNDHYLTIRPSSNLTGNRTLAIATGDAARTITLSGDPTLADWFDQSVKVAATPTLAGLTISGTGASALDVAGGINAGSGNVGIVDTTGKIPAISSTYFASLSGANLTGIPETAITDGSLLARYAEAFAFTAFGAYTITATGTGAHSLTVRNSSAGTANTTSLLLGNDASASAGQLIHTSTTYTAAGSVPQDGMLIASERAGGISINAANAAGDIRFYSANTLRGTIVDTGLFDWDGAATFDGTVTHNGTTVFNDTATTEGIVPGADNTYTLGSATVEWSRIFVNGGATLTPGITFNKDATVGIVGGTDAIQFNSGGADNLFTLQTQAAGNLTASIFPQAVGTGNVPGHAVIVGRNGSGNGAAGCIGLDSAAGTRYYLWVDATGDLRIGTAQPHEDGTPSDTSGTVVGTQS